MDEEIKEKVKKFFKEHIDDVPDVFRETINNDDFYNVNNVWVLTIMALVLANKNYKKEDD